MSRRITFALTMTLLCSGIAFFHPGVAQTDTAIAQAATGTVIIALGTRGGPFPTKDRTQSSNLLEV